MSMKLELGDGVSACHVGDVVVFLWRDAARSARIDFLDAEVHAAMKVHPDGIIMCQLILPSSTPPDAPAREKSSKLLADPTVKLRRLVTAALGDGLWQSVVRTIIRGMLMMSKQSALLCVVASRDEALTEVQRYASADTPPREALLDAIAALYKSLNVEQQLPGHA